MIVEIRHKLLKINNLWRIFWWMLAEKNTYILLISLSKRINLSFYVGERIESLSKSFRD